MDRTKSLLHIFFFFDNLFHPDVHFNTKKNFRYIVTFESYEGRFSVNKFKFCLFLKVIKWFSNMGHFYDTFLEYFVIFEVCFII